MILKRGVLALLIGLASMRPAAAAVRLGAEPWIRVEGRGLTIYSDADPQTVMEMARRLDRMSELVGRSILPQPAGVPPARLFLFRSSASFDPYRDAVLGTASDKDGIFFSRPAGSFIVLDGGSRNPQRVAYHELTHRLVHGSLGEVPLWLNEGLAGLFETFRVERGRVQAARLEPRELRLLRTKRIPTAELLAMTVRSEDFLRGTRSRLVYAQTRLMVHYLLVGSPAHRDRLPAYVALLREGVSPSESFVRAFGMSLRQFDRELLAYAHRNVHDRLVLTGESDGFEPLPPRAVPMAEILSELAAVLAEAGPASLTTAEEMARNALALDSEAVRAHETLGLVHQWRGELEPALGSYETAIALGCDDPIVLSRAARIAFRAARRADGERRDALMQRAVDLLRRRVALTPDDADEWSALGITLVRRGDSAAAIPAFETALRLEPAHRTAMSWLRRIKASDQ